MGKVIKLPIKKSLIIGIDPGYSGGIVFLVDDKIKSKRPLDRFIMGEGRHKQVLIRDLAEYLDRATKYNCYCYIEKAQAMTLFKNGKMIRQGSVSTFNYGYFYGVILGVLVTLGIPYSEIKPKTWQEEIFRDKYRKGRKNLKALSVSTAQQLFPNDDFRKSKRARKAHDGITDALMMGLYGIRYLGK